MADQWYYAKGGQQLGPVSTDELKQKIATGEVAATDNVWKDGMANWLPASTVPELSGGGYAPAPQGYAAPQAGYAAPAGAPLGYGGYAPTGGMGQSYKKEAQTAMILSIVGIFCCGIILGSIGLVKGNQAQKNMQASGNFEGQGMAKAAVIIGIIDVVLFVIGIILRFTILANSGR